MRLANLSNLTTVVVVLLFSAFSVSASTILTVDNSGTDIFQQTENSPCVIGDPSCTNPSGFDVSVIPSNTSPYDVSSPTYTVQQIRDIVGNQFIVGVDVNQNNDQILHLDTFTLAINDTVQFALGGGTDLALLNNGNGYSDSLIKGFNLSSFAGTDSAVFRAVASNANDGREEYFLISGGGGTVIPEPGTLVLMGVGLSVIGIVRWRRRTG
jgi:hypothetical protein